MFASMWRVLSAIGEKSYSTIFMKPTAKKSALLFNLPTELLNRHTSAACATLLYFSSSSLKPIHRRSSKWLFSVFMCLLLLASDVQYNPGPSTCGFIQPDATAISLDNFIGLHTPSDGAVYYAPFISLRLNTSILTVP